MDQLFNKNLEQREQTRAALAEKLELLQNRLEDSVEQVKTAVRRTTDVKYQVSQRPWVMMGLSVFAGRIVGGLLGGGKKRRRRRGSARTGLAREYGEQRNVVKGAAIGALTSLMSELARKAIPVVVRRMESAWQNKPSGSEYTQTSNTHYRER